MTEPTEKMDDEARAWVSEHCPGSLDVRIEREALFAEGMAHAAALIEADARGQAADDPDCGTARKPIRWVAVLEFAERIARGEWLPNV